MGQPLVKFQKALASDWLEMAVDQSEVSQQLTQPHPPPLLLLLPESYLGYRKNPDVGGAEIAS